MFLFIGIKAKLHKIYIKEIFFLRKGFSFVPVLKKMYFFSEYSSRSFFFAKKNYSENQSHGIQSAENIFFFLKGKKPRGICALCFKSSKMLRIGQLMRVLQLSELK